MNKKKILIFIICLISLISLSFAFFIVNIDNNVSSNSIEAATLKINYVDGANINLEGILPGSKIIKTFDVQNIGTKTVNYSILLDQVINTFKYHSDVTYELVCNDNNLASGNFPGINKTVVHEVSIDPEEVHHCELTINYINRADNQNLDMGARISAVIQINDKVEPLTWKIENADDVIGDGFSGIYSPVSVSDKVCYGNDCFYVIEISDIGHYVKLMKADTLEGSSWFDDKNPSYSDLNPYDNSLIKSQIDNYDEYLTELGITHSDATLLSKYDLECLINDCQTLAYSCYNDKKAEYPWVFENSTWLYANSGLLNPWYISDYGCIKNDYGYSANVFGTRPVIEIPYYVVSDVYNPCENSHCTKYVDFDNNQLSVGDMVCYGNECFYVVDLDNNEVSLFAQYNLNVGGNVSRDAWGTVTYYEYVKSATNLQDAYCSRDYCSTVFSNTSTEYSGSIAEKYVNNYANYLSTTNGINIKSSNLMTIELLNKISGTPLGYWDYVSRYFSSYPWIYDNMYFINTKYNANQLLHMRNDSYMSVESYSIYSGIRPLIIIDNSDF